MAEEESDQDIKSKRVTLADLSAKGAALYGEKKYEDAVDIFSKASTLQASINGETAPENAEILFHYGRSLFKVGQSKSDVLGGPATAVAVAADSKHGGGEEHEAKGADAKKPLFQFTGDENFDQDDEEDEGEDEDAEGADDEGEEAPDDELAMAFEILDLARVCYLKQLQNHEASSSEKDKDAQDSLSPALRHMKERLADTHDCLAEISLENERYQDAIEDGRISLKYKKELYPEDSEIIAEAHYKLSLALEFASVNPANEPDEKEEASSEAAEGSSKAAEGSSKATKKPAVNQALRDEAIQQLNLAIKSIRLKLQNNEVELATMASPEDNDAARKAIADMKDVVADMEQKLVDLKENPLGASALLSSLASSIDDPAALKLGISEALALDVNDLVRKKRKAGDGGDDGDDDGKQKSKVRRCEPPSSVDGEKAGETSVEAASSEKPKLDDKVNAAA
ncbi:hypothetical protein CP533_4325 [Ophiocordyceps camponoti-saundersi (nom. inval.)]|nr:hypothetical protein CP533_4325 [Ophiocordyceps camponoti-saundersi (nom. inval.)]